MVPCGIHDVHKPHTRGQPHGLSDNKLIERTTHICRGQGMLENKSQEDEAPEGRVQLGSHVVEGACAPFTFPRRHINPIFEIIKITCKIT